ncbi:MULTISPECIES: Fic family protein [Brevibacterium]|uniref:Fic family protein n=1 Tax=Brevibacterium antiquum CNRZ 918 TaxID=1255637 RepID=A0A2H1ICT2_9MICO|nr:MULTISPECIES: Fic family protein [Brevibacterium]SMX73021.1 Fic family protein [Brevibacterium antiquum CNRZ 918]HCG56864.1 Fic family protein [Brevibacterium sp.]
MPDSIERYWASPNPAGLSRKDRASGTYRAYIPDELPAELPELGREAQRAAEAAVAVLARLDERIGELGARYLNHLLIRSESISSSWIEGNRLSLKKLAIAERLQHGSRVALDVIANVRATEAAIAELADPNRAITISDIEELQHSIEPRLNFGLRQEQNWVGGPGNSPLRAEFIPPPETEVPRLTADLAEFLTNTSGNAVVRAALAHAQFETIHPFADGNGRTGRALIHTVLKRSDAIRNVLVPISTVFASDTDAYIGGLTSFRRDPADLDGWVLSFAAAVEHAADNAILLSEDIIALDHTVVDDLVRHRQEQGKSPARPRANSTILKILDGLAREPVLTIDSVATEHGVSRAAAYRALVELTGAGILRRTTNHKGKIVCFTADRHLAYVELTESNNRRR